MAGTTILPLDRNKKGWTQLIRYSRGKKCDEAWNQDGGCERCKHGGLECHGRSSPVKRTRNLASRPSTTYHDEQPSPSRHGNGLTGYNATYQHPVTQSHQHLPVASPSVSDLRSTPLDKPYIPIAGPSTYDPGPSSVDPAFLMHSAPVYPDNTTPIPIGTPGAGNQFNWLKDGHSEPFAFLNTNFDSSQVVDVDSVPPQWTSNSFWDDFGSFLVPQMNMSPFNPGTTTGLESRLMYVPGTTDNPMRRGVSLAEICKSASREYDCH
jgi:hypothetical protein